MKITRRKFVKISGTAAAGTVFVGGLGFDLSQAEAYARELRIKGAKETTTICCYCSVGCGILVQTKEGKVINAEGDPEHPVSEGSLCSKGSSLYQTVHNDSRLRKPRYRAPGSAAWKDVEWDWALDQIRELRAHLRRTVSTLQREPVFRFLVADRPARLGA